MLECVTETKEAAQHAHGHGSRKSAPHGSASAHGHDHGHGHGGLGHAHASSSLLNGSTSARRALTISLVLNSLFLVVELVIGFWTGSLALLSDAAHMVSDVAALCLALGASALAQRLTDSERTYGLVRAEALGAFVNALALVVTCGLIFKEAVQRLSGTPEAILGVPVLIVGGLGLIINLGSAWMLARSDQGNLNVRGAMLHMLSDALGSFGAMVAAVLVLNGFAAADAVVSLLIGLLVLAGTCGLLRESAAVLLEFSPRGLSVAEVRQQLSNLDDVANVHDLHVWSLDGRSPILSAHLVQGESKNHSDLLRQAETLLRERFGVTHCTLQIESASNHPCEARECCNLLPKGVLHEPH